MNRRTFLKSLAATCGAAIVCPGELVKIDLWIRAAALRKKNADMGAKLCYGKHGQHCCCNSCVNDIMADCLPPLPVYMIDHPAFHHTVYTMHNFGGRRSGYIVTRST